MPEFTVDAVARRNTDQNTIELCLNYKGRQVTMTAPMGATIREVAALALEQEFPPTPPQTFQRRFVIDADRDDMVDPETGDIGLIWVIHSVTAAQLPNERARDEFTNLPGWATWTGAEAAQWIADNVTDLASAKTALTAMARAIVALRDWR